MDLPDHYVLLGVKDCETFWEKLKLLLTVILLRNTLACNITHFLNFGYFYKTHLCSECHIIYNDVSLGPVWVQVTSRPEEGDKSLHNSSVVPAIKMANVPI